jgi:pimeloyl-ACP methyl ester carboxylesterase
VVVSDVLDGLVTVGGRRVAYCLYGAGGRHRTLFQYGTPGVRWLSPQLIAAASRAGAALLVIDRPGYGGSSRRPGRRVVDVVDEVAAVLAAVGWQQCALWGGSGGGPHALALAARLPDRVNRCASVVGLAPPDAPGLNWYAGMSAGNVEEFEAAAAGEQHYRPLVQRLAAEAVTAVERGGIQVADGYDLPEADRRALAARRAETGYLDRMRATYTGGIDGWVDDGIAFTQPWGFELADITVPVSVWYGVQDVLGPRAHPEYLLTAIATAERRELAGGHVLQDADLDAVYAWLCDGE